MQFRHRPFIYNRRFMYSNNSNTAAGKNDVPMAAGISAEEFNKIEEIPLPNEAEPDTPPPSSRELAGNRGSSPLDFIKSRIHIDDIILIGLLFLILDDGFDDDFFLIILLYILLF